MIPKIIWQTYEVEYQDLSDMAKELIESWKNLNLGWEYNYFSKEKRELMVKENFGEEWYQIYKSYKLDILRSDLWRYMCLYTHGGFYSDLDMLCKKPIESWLDVNSKFVVSVEPDVPGYTQSIFASEPKNIFLKNILNDIKDQYYKNEKYKNVVDYETKETGYIIFTDSIIKTMKKTRDGFIEFIGQDAKKIHYESIDHYRAGNGGFFDSSYKSWKTETI
jgi:mannosyltransferase OCH1-like enzyme